MRFVRQDVIEAGKRQVECSYPYCGCAEARLCDALNGPNDAAVALNLPQRKHDFRPVTEEAQP